MFFRKTKKIAISFLLALFSFTSIAGFLFSAQPSQAQLGTLVLGDVVSQAQNIWDMLKNTWKVAVMNAAQQAVSYFVRKVAYDSAVYIASGGKGQNPFAQKEGMYDYLSEVGGEAVGAAVDALGSGWGLDLCKIPDLKLDLALRIGLHYNYGAPPPKPRCDWNSLADNWGKDAWKSRYGDPSKTFSASLKVDDTDLGIALKTTEKLDRLYLTQTDSAKAQNIQNQGWKDFTGLIDGKVKTPASVIQQEAKANTPSKMNEKSEAQVGFAMGSGAYEIIPSTLSLFLNTLTSQVVKNFREKGMLPFGTGCVTIPGVTGQRCPESSKVSKSASSAATELSGRAVAEATFSELLVTPLSSMDDYDVLSQLRSCTDQRGLYNCRIDEQFVNALNADKINKSPVTIQEALTNGWLHGSWPLVPPTNVLLNTDPHCYDGNYCYGNLKVLRQLGIFPIGMELAAKLSNQDTPPTLEEVVKNFYNCPKADNNGVINYDPINFPFCHLVDPNWVIKLSDTRCNALGYTDVPLDGISIPDRIQECVDLKTCIGKDSSGHCLSYANCIRSKNIWKIDGKSCQPQNSTCRAFTDSNNNQVAYLYRTLDTGSCDQNNVGCNGYSLIKNFTSTSSSWASITSVGFGNYNTGIHLNNKITSCDSSAAGCSAFKIVNSTSSPDAPQINAGNNLAYLKKAPNYLHCYDTNLGTPTIIDWPQNFADLNKLATTANPACADYAKVCIADEVGCNEFTNVVDTKSPPVTGKFTSATIGSDNTVQQWNDQCAKSCVGYGAYQELPTDFSEGTALAYIIPPSDYNNNQSGTTCPSQDSGCSAFTNMESTQNGGEKVDYFVHLRACIKPNPDQQKNFYTYEGTSAGYQLKTYSLQKTSAGAPMMALFTADDNARAALCNEQQYKTAQVDPANFPGDKDCRQFNDDQGNTYYALLPFTVVVSPDCTQYRLDSETALAGNTCLGNGQFKDGSCYYLGLPKGSVAFEQSSQDCTEDKLSCRGYKGNHSNNIAQLVEDSFATLDPTKSGSNWSSANGTLVYSGESTKTGGHSLGFSGNSGATLERGSVNLTADSIDVLSDTSLSLSFWAKGTGETVEIKLVDEVSGANKTVASFVANNVWRVYKFEPIKWPYDGKASLTFELADSGNLYLDNVYLTKVSELTYLLKNSLKIDPLCDDEPNDNLPGAALGCTAYSGPFNTLGAGDKMYYLTNFSYLCRDGAKGCTAYVDTFNKPANSDGTPGASTPIAYNVWLPGKGGNKVSINVGDAKSCQIEVGQAGCFVNVRGVDKATIIGSTVVNSGLGSVSPEFVDSTYFLPADSDSLSYLVYDDHGSCDQTNLGCTYAGVQKVTPQGTAYETTTIKLDPAQFETVGAQNGTLCTAQAVGCGDFGGSYFKDPAVTGAKVCKFGDFTTNGVAVKGWYWKDVGICSNSTNNCSSDNQCGTGTCENRNTVPCYADNYKKDKMIGNYYDLWSFGNTSTYKNFVGECPVEEDKCSEFVDHNDDDKSYTYIKDDDLDKSGKECDGVSQKIGCILFDETSNPSKYWSTSKTYNLSDGYLYNAKDTTLTATKVPPQADADPNKNNSNKVLKVTRDRECGEWLQCNGSQGQWNIKLKKMEQKCSSIGLCDQLSTVAGANGKEATCAEFVDGQNEYSGKPLSADLYVHRDITWGGHDLTGMSILGSFPLNELEQYNVSTSTDPDKANIKLLKRLACGGGTNCASTSTTGSYLCKDTTFKGLCGANGDGVCVNGVCLQSDKGFTNSQDDIYKKGIGDSCRAYPEKDSPFPSSNSVVNDQKFKSVNRCSEDLFSLGLTHGGDNYSIAENACECDYTKVNFGNKTAFKFYNQLHPKMNDVLGVCSGGDKEGKMCDPSEPDTSTTSLKNCYPNGTCIKKDNTTQTVFGWHGYCLEKDDSRILHGTGNTDLEHPCMTWLPIDLPVGAQYSSNLQPGASALKLTGMPNNMAYCLQAEKYMKQPVGKGIFITEWPSSSDSDCRNWWTYAYFDVDLSKPFSLEVQDDMWNGTGDTYCRNRFGLGYVMNRSYTMVTEQEITPDGNHYCHSYCEADPDYDKIWSSAVREASYNQMGCSIMVDGTNLFDLNKFVPWSDNLWRGWTDNTVPSYEIAVNKIISKPSAPFVSKLNFKNQTTKAPFGSFVHTGVDKSLNILSTCVSTGNSATQFYQPSSYNKCLETDSEIWEQAGITKTSILSYDPWNNTNTYTQPTSTQSELDKKNRTADAIRLLSQVYSKIPVDSLKTFDDCVVKHKEISGKTIVSSGCNYSQPQYDQKFNYSDLLPLLDTTAAAPIQSVPVVHPLGPCSGDQCQELNSNGFTINNNTPKSAKDNLLITTKPFEAKIKYFYGADKNHMPVKRTIVDFDDANNFEKSLQISGNVSNGSMANYRGNVKGTSCVNNGCEYKTYDGLTMLSGQSCKTDFDCTTAIFPLCVDESSAPAFSYIVDKSCIPTFQVASYNYNCAPEKTNPNYHEVCTLDDFNGNQTQYKQWHDPNYGFGLNDCCVYHPKVQVLDNWNWCNGTCPGGTDGTTGCYNGETKLECTYPIYKETASTKFIANVIVAPNTIKIKP